MIFTFKLATYFTVQVLTRSTHDTNWHLVYYFSAFIMRLYLITKHQSMALKITSYGLDHGPYTIIVCVKARTLRPTPGVKRRAL